MRSKEHPGIAIGLAVPAERKTRAGSLDSEEGKRISRSGKTSMTNKTGRISKTSKDSKFEERRGGVRVG